MKKTANCWEFELIFCIEFWTLAHFETKKKEKNDFFKIFCKILIAICIPFLYNELKRYIGKHKGVFCLCRRDNPLSAPNRADISCVRYLNF